MYFPELQMIEYDTRSVPEGEYKTSSHFDFSKLVLKGFWRITKKCPSVFWGEIDYVLYSGTILPPSWVKLVYLSLLWQGSGNEGLPMGQSGEKLSRPKYVMLYLFLGQNFPQNPFLKSKMPPEVSFSISHFSIHFFLYKIWQFCSIFVEKKINLLKYLF